MSDAISPVTSSATAPEDAGLGARFGLRPANRALALSFAGLLLLLSHGPSVADDRATCLADAGSPTATIAACDRGLDSWLVTDANRRALRVARARQYSEVGRGEEAVRELRDVASQLERLIARIEQDAHDCFFKWNCRSFTTDSVGLDAVKNEHRRVTALLERTQSGQPKGVVGDGAKPAVAATPPSLVRRAQTALATLGYAVGKADGKIGPLTRRALAAYQRAAGLPAGTPIDEAFLGNLEAAAEVRSEQVAAATVRPPVAIAAAGETTVADPPPPSDEQPDQAPVAADIAPSGDSMRMEPLPDSPAEPIEVTKALEPTPPQAEELLPEGLVAAGPDLPAPASAAAPATPTVVGSPGRIALVIGNGAYRNAPALPNPGNDAADLAVLLQRMHFTVMQGSDLDRAGMEDLMIRFAKAASNAEIAVAFYAGHAIQVDGTNYLVPVDAAIEDELDLRRLVRLSDMVRDTGRADRFGLVMVDACRDNPFEASLTRSLRAASRSLGPTRGLAAPEVPPRVLVFYATGATETAADGSGRNSPFTSAVLDHLAEPDDVRIVVGKIVDTVAETTDQRQRPDYWGSLGGDRIFLVNPEAVAEALDVQLTTEERETVQRSLARMGLYAGATDGQFTPAVRRAIRDFQIRSGAAATGFLNVDQLLALYEAARFRSEPKPLPPIDIIELLRRSEAGERDAALLRAKLFDRAYTPGPLPKDMAEAARWYQKAAEAGDAEAALTLARMLRDGDGVEPDPAAAARWLSLAVEAGSPEAQHDLAQLYADGNGVPLDQGEAIRLYRLAATNHFGEAITRLRALQAWEAP